MTASYGKGVPMKPPVTALVCAAFLALGACGPTAASSEKTSADEPTRADESTSLGNEFVGTWSQQRRNDTFGKTYTQYIDIQKEDSTFLLNFHATVADFAGGQFGTYAATYQNGMLHPATPGLGDIVYIRSSGTILVAGSAFTRN